MKNCPRCGPKPHSAFAHDKNRLDGRYPVCRECTNRRARAVAKAKKQGRTLRSLIRPRPRPRRGQVDLREVGQMPCACGCGGNVSFAKRQKQSPIHHIRSEFFIHGHNGRGKIRPEIRKAKFCICGCGGMIAATARAANGQKFIEGHRPKRRISQAHKDAVGRAQRIRPRRKWTVAEKAAWSLAQRAIARYGEDNPNWRGGTTPAAKLLRRSPEYRDWRKAVFLRDNWTCQSCHVRGGRLHPHHIKPVSICPGRIFDVRNGLTLCVECHRDLHKGFRPWLTKRKARRP